MSSGPPRPGWQRQRARALLACVLVPLLAGSALAQDPPPLVQAVAGIISFTRWPTALASVTLCVIGPADRANALFAGPIQAGSVPVQPRRARLADPLDDCHAVFLGPISLVERRLLNRKLEGRSVLTMGEASPDCTDYTMFCLTTDARSASFTTNIDMIARGGVRLNPRVLLLGRRPAGAP